MDRLHREFYPYRERLSRMDYFPGLKQSGRPYDRDSEAKLWQWSRVAEHLSTYVLVRRVDRSGLVSLYNRGRYVNSRPTPAGRFRANPGSGHRYLFSAFPPEGEPYLNVQQNLDWPKGAIEHSLDLVLPQGILVRGRVTEEGSGKPIAGARVGYLSNPDRDPRTGAWNTRAATAADGSFQLGVMPARGYLSVLGPGEDYVLQEIGQRMALTGQPGGRRIYSHAFHGVDLNPGSVSQEVAITLRPSAAVKGRVVGPDGQPVPNALVISRVILQPTWIAWLFWTAAYRDAVRDGCFAVHGLAPDTEAPVYFLDARHNLGATAFLSGRSAAAGPVTVRLQPCGAGPGTTRRLRR